MERPEDQPGTSRFSFKACSGWSQSGGEAVALGMTHIPVTAWPTQCRIMENHVELTWPLDGIESASSDEIV
jgi:hypothetical protein